MERVHYVVGLGYDPNIFTERTGLRRPRPEVEKRWRDGTLFAIWQPLSLNRYSLLSEQKWWFVYDVGPKDLDNVSTTHLVNICVTEISNFDQSMRLGSHSVFKFCIT